MLRRLLSLCPLLECLSFELDGHTDVPIASLVDLPATKIILPQQLHTLKLAHVDLQALTPQLQRMPHLTSLHHDSRYRLPPQIWTMLPSQLTSLRIHVAWSSEDVRLTQVMQCLPHLRRLRIASNHISPVIATASEIAAFPSLEHLSVRLIPEAVQRTTPVTPRSELQLHTLKLFGPVESLDEFAALFVLAPHLVHLQLEVSSPELGEPALLQSIPADRLRSLRLQTVAFADIAALLTQSQRNLTRFDCLAFVSTSQKAFQLHLPAAKYISISVNAVLTCDITVIASACDELIMSRDCRLVVAESQLHEPMQRLVLDCRNRAVEACEAINKWRPRVVQLRGLRSEARF